MNRFICKSGKDINQIDSKILDLFSFDNPAQIHYVAENIADLAIKSQEMSGRKCIRIPFCNTLLAEALGANVKLSLNGAFVKNEAYEKAEQIQENTGIFTKRIEKMVEAVEIINSFGKKIIFNIDGPLTILSSLLPMAKLYSFLRKPSGKEFFRYIEDVIINYANAVCEKGIYMISYADPLASLDILGNKMFEEIYSGSCEKIISEIHIKNPQIPVHICGKLTQDLVDIGEFNIKEWKSQSHDNTYEETIDEYLKTGINKSIIGLNCLNKMNNKCNKIFIITFSK